MIIPMKKYSFLVYHHDYLSFLQGIQELGVLHVIEKQTGEIEDEEIKEKHQKINELNGAIKYLEKFQVENKDNDIKTNGFDALSDLQKLISDQNANEQKLAATKKENNTKLNPGVILNGKPIDKLSDSGFQMQFFICPEKKYNSDWENEHFIFRINEITGTVFFCHFI
ncbi:MAG: hypothetical protein HC906_14480 [Bacteroidales bacterium]|nr:hypothetical protein [Bacteroidales bacterium]